MSIDHAKKRPLVVLGTWVGAAATALACGLVVYGLIKTQALLAIDWDSPATWQILCAGAFVYATAQVLLAAAWRSLLNGPTPVGISRRSAFEIYAISQIFKYLPSNVIHHFGRYTMLRALNIDHFSILWAAGTETLLMIVVSTSIAASFGWPLLRAGAVNLGLPWFTWGLLVAGLATLIVLAIYILARRLRLLRSGRTLRQLSSGIVPATVLYAVFFVVAGLLAAMTLKIVQVPNASVATGQMIAIIAGAWVLGFITPGASAGIGVRETIIAAMVGTIASVEAGLALGAAYRIVTLSGDLLFALLGWSIKLHRRSNKGASSP
jgi:hypothetical protein